MQTILVQEYKDKTIYIKVYEVLTWLDQSCLYLWMRESFRYIIENITKDKNWVIKTSHIFALFVTTF